LKDPLQKEQTPYEVLGLSRGATAEQVDRAFKEGLLQRVNVQKLTAAKQALQQAAERAMVDLFEYDPAALARLAPNPLVDPAALEPPRRWETAKAWEAALKGRFPDLGVVHSLAVLWYWGAIHQQETAGGAPVAGFSIQSLWERAIACWAMVVAGEGFWSATPAEHRESLRSRVTEKIRHKLQDLEQPYRDRGDHAGAQVYQDLELALDTELRTARELAATGIRSANGPLTCGALMLEQMGALGAVRSQVLRALGVAPQNPTLRALRDALSPHGAIAELIRKGDPKSALEAIDRLPQGERQSEEVRALRADALREVANQQASLDQLGEALANWEQALRLSPGLEPAIRADLENHCQARAVALQRQKPAEAISLLEKATQVVRSEKLQLTLAEILTQRGIDTINDAQKAAEDKKEGVTAQLIAAYERGHRDLERGAKLGSERGATQAPIARTMIERARWLMKKARLVDFNTLPPAVRERFVSALAPGGSPRPLLQLKESGASGWVALAVIMAGVTFFSAGSGFAAVGVGLYHGVGGLVSYVTSMFLVTLGVMGAYRSRLLKASHPYPRGKYIFPLDYVDARDRTLRIIPLREVFKFEGVHHHRNGVYTHTEFTFGLTGESLQQIVEKFRVSGKDAAEAVLQELQASRRVEGDALQAGDFQALAALDPFYEGR
jgi:tetratricopeptide (TPR) repeat protein